MAIINKSGITNGSTIEAEHITRAIDALSGVSTDTIVATGSFSGSLKGDANLNTLNVDTIYFPNTPYTVAGSGGNNIILNYDDDDTNTTIKHHGGSVSSSFLETSLTINAPVIASSFTGSLDGTATSASFATTASFALNAGGSGTGFPFTGSAQITGSLGITGSLQVSGSTTINGTTTLTGSINFDQAGVIAGGYIAGGDGLIIDLSEVGKTPSVGTFIIPNRQPDTPFPGSIYITAGRFYIYDGSEWQQIQFV